MGTRTTHNPANAGVTEDSRYRTESFPYTEAFSMSDWGPAACQGSAAPTRQAKSKRRFLGRLGDGQARGREWVPSYTLR